MKKDRERKERMGKGAGRRRRGNRGKERAVSKLIKNPRQGQ